MRIPVKILPLLAFLALVVALTRTVHTEQFARPAAVQSTGFDALAHELFGMLPSGAGASR
jgi:hypothetical protein